MEDRFDLWGQSGDQYNQNLGEYIGFCNQSSVSVNNMNDDKINDFAKIEEIRDKNDTRCLIGRKRNGSQSTLSLEDEKLDYNNNNIVEYAEENLSFDSLFRKCTEWTEGDGNCFIWSAFILFGIDQNSESIQSFRNELQKTFNNMLANHGYEEKYGPYVIEGCKDLEKYKEWVEINPGTVSLAKYVNSEVIVFSKTSGYDRKGQFKTEFSFVVANKDGELSFGCSLEQIKLKVIEGEAKTIILKEKHYQPLKCDYDSRNEFLNGFFSFFIEQRYIEIKNNIKETHESKGESLLNNIRILLPDNSDTDTLYNEVTDIQTNIKDPAEKEKKLYDILDRVYKKSKELYTDQNKVLGKPVNENKKIDKFSKKLCDQGTRGKIELIEANKNGFNKENNVDVNSILDNSDISPEDKEEILNSLFGGIEKEKKPRLDKDAQEQIFGDYYDLY